MARKKVIQDEVPEIEQKTGQTLAPMPADMGREDLNKIAHKINEIISYIHD